MIGILTDSTCDLPADIISRYNIRVIPMKIRLNQESYLDGVTLTGDMFYRHIANSDAQTETEPPTVDEFVAIYADMLRECDEIISIHVGSSFSKTVQNAGEAIHQGHKLFFNERLKVKKYEPFKIRVIDSRNVSIGVGILVYKALQMIRKGVEFNALTSQLQDSAAKTRLLFAPKDLTYLNRSKRLTGFKYLVASLAGLKPVIEVCNGKMEKVTTVRGYEAAAESILEMMYKGMANSPGYLFAVALAGQKADLAGNVISARLPEGVKGSTGYFESIIGSTIGAHCGPETVGAALLAD